MAKLRHVAIASNDPRATATALIEAFGLDETGTCDNELAEGFFLSDGTINIAVLRFRTDQLGRGMDYQGIHHIGFLVADTAEAKSRLAEAGGEVVLDRADNDDQSFYEIKVRLPGQLMLDLSDHPWAGSLPLRSAE